MGKDLSNYRKTYQKSDLHEENTPDNPLELFRTWFYEVEKFGGIDEPNAMNIATIGLDGFPKNRMVLLKRFTWEGFIFYTNYNSEKGKAIAANPNICLSFYWSNLERQVIIKGIAKKEAKNLSDGYFETRPTGSKLGAWASPQSEVVPSRKTLDEALQKLELKYKDKEIPRPPYWGGYLVKPKSMEFWQGRPNRMHDRIRYTLQPDYTFKKERLAP